jgi:hypothetical protein
MQIAEAMHLGELIAWLFSNEVSARDFVYG